MGSSAFLDVENLSQDVVCVFQEDFMRVYLQLTSWLEEKKSRALIFFCEENSSSQEQILFLSQIPQVFCYTLTPENEKQIYLELAWKFVFLPFYFFEGKKEDPALEERQSQVFGKLSYMQSAVHLVASEYADLSARAFRNLFENGPFLENSLPLHLLKNSCKGIPAIICGAGPSLEKEIPLLKECKNKALLFAGGSTLRVLSHFSLDPHGSVSFDPDPPYQRYLEQTAFESPFFYQGRLSSDLCSLVHGKKIIAPANEGYVLEDWLLKKLGKAEGFLDSGWVVGNFAAALATYLGCNPIILVGMDLSFSDSQMYAPGVGEKASLSEVRCKNQEGKEVFTKTDWLMAAKWFTEFAREHKETTFINCTSSGIQIEGIQNLPLKEVIDADLSSYDVQGHFHLALSAFHKAENTFEETKEEFRKSRERAEILCEKILQNMFQNYPDLSKDTGERALLEHDLTQEVFYLVVLQPFWDVWKHVFAREEGEELAGLFVHRILFYKKMIEEFSLIFEQGAEYAGSV